MPEVPRRLFQQHPQGDRLLPLPRGMVQCQRRKHQLPDVPEPDALLQPRHRVDGPVHLQARVVDSFENQLATERWELPTKPSAPELHSQASCEAQAQVREVERGSVPYL
jgi:hypothetical protein